MGAFLDIYPHSDWAEPMSAEVSHDTGRLRMNQSRVRVRRVRFDPVKGC